MFDVVKIVMIIIWLLTFVIAIMRHFYVFIIRQEILGTGNADKKDIVFLLSILFYLTTFVLVVYKYFRLIDFHCVE